VSDILPEPVCPDSDVSPDYAQFSVPYCNDGGPLLVLPRDLVGYWDGAHPPADGRVIETEADSYLDEFAHTDYARACSVTHTPGVLEVGSGQALVLPQWDEQMGTVSLLRLPESAGPMLVIDMDSRDGQVAALVLAELSSDLDAGWEVAIPEFAVDCQELLLMHAADREPEIVGPSKEMSYVAGGAIPFGIAVGTYMVERRRLQTEDILVLRLRRI
jgi:hypothetical protein